MKKILTSNTEETVKRRTTVIEAVEAINEQQTGTKSRRKDYDLPRAGQIFVMFDDNPNPVQIIAAEPATHAAVDRSQTNCNQPCLSPVSLSELLQPNQTNGFRLDWPAAGYSIVSSSPACTTLDASSSTLLPAIPSDADTMARCAAVLRRRIADVSVGVHTHDGIS